MNAVKDYLRLSGIYCEFLGGLRWSSLDDALVYVGGEVFATREFFDQLRKHGPYGPAIPRSG